MGRFVDLCGEVAAAAEEGAEGLVLEPDDWERLRGEFTDDEIEDALSLVHDSLLQAELVESADSLSARVLDVLSELGDEAAFKRVEAGEAKLSLEDVGQLARRVGRLEEILDAFRDQKGPDRRGFERLQARLADYGIEDEMAEGRAEDELARNDDSDEDEDDE